MSQLRRLKQKILQDIGKPSNNPNEGWIIFFDDTCNTPNKRYYFHKMYSIGRPRFDNNKFAFFSNILDCHQMLEKLEEAIKLYGVPNVKMKDQHKIKLMAAQATLTDNQNNHSNL